jgi:hypothetical protein
MKKIIFTSLLSVILFVTCDVDGLREQIEKSEIEKTTLTILNLPENVTGENLKQITVGDAAAGGSPAESAVDGTTARVPLLSQDGKPFTETGVYFVRIVIEKPDKTLLELNDIPVEFENGFGTLDLSQAGTAAETERLKGLTILNLPENTIAESFKTVLIGNTARCGDYGAIEMNGLSATVPLELNNGNGEFTKTGVFFITLVIDVDSLTHLEIAAKDKIPVEFTGGSGTLDLADYGGVFFLPRSLTILNLPENVVRDSFQSVDIGGVAKALMDDIRIEDTTAVVPVVLNNGKEFNKTGRFYIILRVIVDSLTDVDITKDDFVLCAFENGKGTLDLENLYGYLGKGYIDGDITNRNNFSEAQVRKSTKFEMNGYFYHVITQAPMDNNYEYALLPNTTVYIYAVEAEGNVMNYRYVASMRNADAFIRFRLSTVKPVYDADRAGWYNGNDRALWKFIKMNGEWRYKTDVGDEFEVENQVLTYPVGNLLYKWENTNISPTKVWLDAGVYCFELAGGGGGDSAYYKEWEDVFYRLEHTKEFDTRGGEGGKIIELASLDSGKQVTVYTGRKGASGSALAETGSFVDLDYFMSMTAGDSFYGEVTRNHGIAISGGGGGGGSFISWDLGQPGDYFLCAGGGAGASGTTVMSGLSGASHPRLVSGFHQSVGGNGGGADRGGDGGGIPGIVSIGTYWETGYDDSEHGYQLTGKGYAWDFSIGVITGKASGGGVSGIGNAQVVKAEAVIYFPGSTVVRSDVKELLKAYQSTIGIGGEPSPAFSSIDYNKTYKPEEFAGGKGGNNRNTVRGGNSGDGYVRVYSLN